MIGCTNLLLDNAIVALSFGDMFLGTCIIHSNAILKSQCVNEGVEFIVTTNHCDAETSESVKMEHLL